MNIISIETLNYEFICNYKDNEFIYKLLNNIYNNLISSKIREYKDKESFEKNYLFFVDKTIEFNKFYGLNLSFILDKAINLESELILKYFINSDLFVHIESEEFFNILFRKNISESFTLFLLNLNVFDIEISKNIFVNNINNHYSGTMEHSDPILIYNYFNDKKEFSFKDNFEILELLIKRNNEHPLFHIVFDNTIEFLSDKNVIEFINLIHKQVHSDSYGRD